MNKIILTAIASIMMSTMAFADDSVKSEENTVVVKEQKCDVPKPANRNHVPDHHSCR